MLGECRDLKICVSEATIHVDILRAIFPSPNLVEVSGDMFYQSFIDGDAMSSLASRMIWRRSILCDVKVLSKEPLGENAAPYEAILPFTSSAFANTIHRFFISNGDEKRRPKVR